MRGARLLLEPDATEPDLQGDASRVLVVISRGPQPTPGYGLELLGASQEGTDIHLQYAWTEPDDHTMLAQVITHPCSVVELDDATADSLAGLSIGASIAEEQLTALQLQ